MKKIIALAVLLNTTTAFAFFNDAGNTSGSFVNDGRGEVNGNATGEGEGSFSMTFEGSGETNGKVTGNGMSNGAANARGDDASDNAAGNGVADGSANGRGEGDAEGTARFSMSFTGRAKANGDFAGNGSNATNSNVSGESRDVYRPPYYGTRNFLEPEAGK